MCVILPLIQSQSSYITYMLSIPSYSSCKDRKNILKMNKEVGMLLQTITNTSGVQISNTRTKNIFKMNKVGMLLPKKRAT